MADKSPTSLRTPRNVALQKGTVPAGYAPPVIDPSEQPLIHKDDADAARGVGNSPPPATPAPFTIKGGGR